MTTGSTCGGMNSNFWGNFVAIS